MRIYIYIIIISLLCVSCENEIPFNIDNKAPKLVINALWDSNKEKNDIMLALTGRDNVTYINEATISIYVNGVLKDYITEPDPDEEYVQYPIYRTKVRFDPDDVLKIEVKTNDGKYYAQSEVTVPQPIPIEKIDTTLVTKNLEWYSSDKYLRVKTTFTDNDHKTNYYRILMITNAEIEAKSSVTLADTTVYETFLVPLIIREDVVLTDGRPSPEDDDVGLLPPIRNLYGVFDNSRINGTYTMITSLRIPYSYFDYYGYGFFPLKDVKRIGIDVKVRLMSISKMQYFYLKALNIYDSVEYDDYLNLPVKFPSNIEGGTGIFGVSIGDEITIQLEDYIPESYNYPIGKN